MRKTSFFTELLGYSKTEPTPRLDESLFLALMSSIPGQSWYVTLASEEDNFTAGINLPGGTITAQLPLALLDIASRTGANLLPMPFSSVKLNREETIQKLLQFASR